jgi:hypothetical protein
MRIYEINNLFFLYLAVSQILDSLEDIQWLTISDRVDVDFLQKLFEDKQLQTLLEVKTDSFLLFCYLISYLLVI